MPLTRELGGFVAGLSFRAFAGRGDRDRPHRLYRHDRDDDRRLARRGAAAAESKALRPPPGPATLYFTGETAPAPEAAWINGTAAHALDYDDVAVRGHPSTVLVPAILAEGEALGASGQRR